MTSRKLRIAWSVTWSVVAVLLVVLWVRDYFTTRLIASMAYAFPTLISFGLAVASWTAGPTRFSLRTLLIATTLVAVVLGLFMYLLK